MLVRHQGMWELCVPDMHPKPTPFSQVSAYHVLSPHYDAFPTSRCVAQPRSAGYRVRGLHGLHTGSFAAVRWGYMGWQSHKADNAKC